MPSSGVGIGSIGDRVAKRVRQFVALAYSGCSLELFRLGVLTYLSGLATLSEEVIEAARLDGAGYWVC